MPRRRAADHRNLKRNVAKKLTLGLAVVIMGGCAQGSPQIVARVGQADISKQQLAHWTLVLAGAKHRRSGEQVHARVSALGFLIKARWVEGWAHATGVAASQSEAARQLSLFEYARRRRLPVVPFEWQDELEPYLTSPGATALDRLWLMTLSTLHRALHRRQLSQVEGIVTHAQIETYYRRSRRRLFVPEMRDIAIMESSSLSAMIKAKQALTAGMSPEAAAKRFSSDPVDPGGLKLGYERGKGAPALDDAIFSARPNTVVGPLQVSWYYVFEVLAVRPRRGLTLAEVSGRIKREVAEKAAEVLDGSLQREWTSRTDCRRGYVVVGCQQYQAT